MKGKENFYYVFSNGQRSKAMRWSELKSKRFPSYALVWTKGMNEWKQLDQFMSKRQSARTPGKIERDEYFVSRVLVLLMFQRMIAALLDLLLLLTILYLFRVLFIFVYTPENSISPFTFLFRFDLQSNLTALVIIFYLLSGWVYFALFESSSIKATPGKLFLQLQVNSATHMQITLAQATIRYWCKFLSFLPFLLGFIMILWNPQKQSLHDFFSDTYVIKNGKWIV